MTDTSSTPPAGPAARDRVADVCVVAATIVLGLALRRWGPGLGLPFVVTKYGGSLLWAVMVHGLVVIVSGRNGRAALAASAAIALAVEASRLVHTPALDAFRPTTVGALLLGRVFSPWNLVAYGAGITLAAHLFRVIGRRRR